LQDCKIPKHIIHAHVYLMYENGCKFEIWKCKNKGKEDRNNRYGEAINTEIDR
jgi:hypothetical protein